MFPPTPWTLIAAATLNGDSASRQALEKMCAIYRPAVFDFLSRKLSGSPEAEDLTQEFFVHLLESRLWQRADHEKGRFRNFLLGAVMRVVSNDWRQRSAQKRGSGANATSLEDLPEPAAPSVDDTLLFDRAWAQAMLDAALIRIESEWTDPEEFAVLQRFLPGGEGTPAYAQAAESMHCSLGAFKSKVLRLRQRYRECIESEIVRTVSRPEDVAAELTHLQRVLMDPEHPL